MIDDKKIEEAARRYSEVTDCDKQEALLIEEGFKEGAEWAISEFLTRLWHPASEEPRKDVSIIVETHNDKNMFYYAWTRWQDNFFKGVAGYCGAAPLGLKCLPKYRSDKKNVIFKEVKE